MEGGFEFGEDLTLVVGGFDSGEKEEGKESEKGEEM